MIEVELPDGSVAEFPDGMPPDQIQSILAKQFSAPAAAAPAPAAESPFVAGGLKGAAGGVLRGLADPIMGGWQMGARGLEELMPSGSRAEGLVRAGRQGLERWNESAEQDYRQNFRGGEDIGFDVARMVGNVAGTAPLAAALPGAGLGLAARTGIGAASGAGFGALQPVSGEDDYWSRKGEQAALGGVFGAAAAPLTAGLSRMISPRSSPQVQALRAEGIQLTPGETAGGMLRRAEEAVSSLPIMGASIRGAKQAGTESLNRAAINRALFPIGAKLPKGVVGNEAMEFADDALGRAYTRVIDKIGAAPVDDQLLDGLARLQSLVSMLPKEKGEQLGRIIDNEILARTQYGRIPGEAVKAAESNLGQMARGWRRSQDYDQRQLGIAVQETQRQLREWLERVAPPGVADELRRVNTGWANFLRPERAASSVAANEGVFTAAQLQNAVKALDPSKNKRAFAQGNALMQDLSSAAKSTMGSTLNNSGTADRAIAAYALTSALNPTKWPSLLGQTAGVGLASIPYLPGVRQGVNWALAGRQGAPFRQAGQGLMTLSPALGAALSPLGIGLLEPAAQ